MHQEQDQSLGQLNHDPYRRPVLFWSIFNYKIMIQSQAPSNMTNKESKINSTLMSFQNMVLCVILYDLYDFMDLVGDIIHKEGNQNGL